MTCGIFGKNQKFEDFLIFVETSPITIYERLSLSLSLTYFLLYEIYTNNNSKKILK